MRGIVMPTPSRTVDPAVREHLPTRRAATAAVLAAAFLALSVLGGGVLAADPPVPSVSVGLGGTAMIGAPVTFTVSFDNTSASDTGYGPYVDLRLPKGADGDDGLTFSGATYLGTAVTATQLTADASGCVTHPLAVDASGAHRVICGLAAGQSFVVLRLPFGSFTPDQPAVQLSVSATMSTFADAGTPLAVTAAGGFQFGATPVADPATDPSIAGATSTGSVTPSVITLTKTYSGDESETATGPQYGRQYTIAARVAPGQVVTNLDVTDVLPGTVQFESVSGSTPASTALATPSTSTPGGTVTRRYATVTGTGGGDASFNVDFHVPLVDDASQRVVNPVTGAANTSIDTATAIAAWTPLDPRDTPVVVTAGPATHTLIDRSIAIQKSVALAPDGDVAPLGVVNPGDTVQWTMHVQVSDFFAFSGVHLHDKLADGTRLDPTFVPTLAVAGNGYSLPAAPFDPANVTLGPVDGSGITLSVLRISDELVTRLQGPRLIGGCVDPAGGTVTPACGTYHDGATTATVVMRSIVQDTYAGGGRIVEGDGLGNETSVTGDVLNTSTFAPTGQQAGDGSAAVASPGSGASVTIPKSTLTKEIYAIDGSTSFATPVHIQPGDTITFRLRQSFPTSRIDDLRLTDYLPLPVLDATELTHFDATASAAAPPAGWVKLGPADTFHALVPAPAAPGLSSDPVSNSVSLFYGDYAAPLPGTPSVADILFTVTVRNNAFADGLLLTNLARTQSKNAAGQPAVTDSIIQFVLDQPVLALTKGVVATDAPGATLTPGTPAPRPFAAPGSAACPAWTGGDITSAGLAAHPVDADVSGVDAGDLVRFAIALENTGHFDAYDVVVADDLPAGFVVPGGGLHLCVTRGDGSVPVVANAGGGGGLFDQGLLVTGAAGAAALVAGADGSGAPNADGTNVLVVSFDLEVDATARPLADIVNTAALDGYSNATGGPNHLASPLEDPATTTVSPIAIRKSVTGSDQAHTTPPAVAIGEVLTYEVVVTVPEGSAGPVTLTDSLPAGLAFVACDSVSASGALSTSLAGGFADACNAPANPSVTPGSGSGGGRTAAFDLGVIVNGDRDDATPETITIVYRATVTNIAANTRGALRANSASVAWNDGTGARSATASSTAQRIVEPGLTIGKSVAATTGDAADVLTYTIVVANPLNGNGAEAFEVALADHIPAGLTYVGGSLTTVSGTAPGSLGVTGSDISATWSTYAAGATTTLQYQVTVDAGVTPGQVITNTAVATWTSLPLTPAATSPYNDVSVERTGNPGDPGGAANTYSVSDPATFTVVPLAPVKTLVTTSEASTTGTSVVVGEIVRYRLVVRIPEGSTPTLTMTDRLPTGLSYLAGTARVALVSTSGGLTSSTLTDADVTKLGDETTLASITPTYAIPAGAVSGGASDGDDVTFDLGSLVNAESDASFEYAVVEINALVDNVGTNTTGVSRSNDVQVRSGGVLKGTSAGLSVTIREPRLTVAKTLTTAPSDAGDALRYTIVVTNTGTATAFDADISDVLDADLVMGAVGFTPSGGATGVTDLSDAPTNTLHLTVTSMAVNATVTITVDATVTADVDGGRTLPNTAHATWTSLPVDGTPANGTGSVTPGPSGAANGERNGSGGVNTYAATGSVNATIVAPSIAKLPITPAGYAIGAEPVFTLRVVIPEGTTRGLTVTDTVPAGLIVTGQATVVAAAGSGGNLAADFAGTLPAFSVTASPAGSAGGALTLSFGDVVNAPDGSAANDAFLVTVSTRVANVVGNQGGTALSNTASLRYTDPESGATTIAAPTPRTVTVIEPVVVVDKTAAPATPVLGGEVTYTLVVTNAGPASTADAFDLDLTDVLPAGLTYVAGSLAHTGGTAPAGMSESGGTISASWTTIALGDSSTLEYKATVGDPGSLTIGQSLINSVHAAWTSLAGTVAGERTGAGGIDDYTTSDSAAVITGGSDPSITKTDGTATATAGATLTYTITVHNDGNLAATGITITETVPDNTTFRTSGSSAGWSCANGAAAGTTCTLAIASVAGASTANRTFVVAVDAPLPPGVASIANTATVTDDGTHGPDPDPTDNSATDTDAVPSIDLSLTKAVDHATPNVGDVVAFTIIVSNAGPATATGVVVHDPLPAGLTYSSASATQGSYASGSGNWSVGAIPADGSATLTLNATVTTAGLKTNIAEVSAANGSDVDSTPGNGDPGEDDRASASLTPLVADLAIVKTVDNRHPDQGDRITFTLTLSNLGPDGATGVTVGDPLPTGLSFVSATPSQGTYNDASGTWDVGSVPVGADVATLVLTADVTAGGPITNTATITHSDVLDPVPGNDTDSANISQVLDLVVAKSVDDAHQDVGADVVFTVTVHNDGPNAATGVVLHDALPSGLTFVGSTGDGTYAAGSGTWTVGSLAAGATATLHVTATVDTPDPATNTATVTDVDQPQVTTTNDTDSATVTPPHADVAVTKTVDDTRPAVGEPATWTITVTNLGPDTARDVVVTDAIPAGLTLDTATPSDGTYDPGTGAWTVGDLADGATETLVLATTVTEAGDRRNAATATTTTYDPDPDNNTADAFLTTKEADIGVTKAVDDDTPAVGQVVRFTITATNNGPDPARRVVLRDRLPSGLSYVADDTGGDYDPATGDWAVGDMAVGETRTLLLDARVTTSGTITNTVRLRSLVETDIVEPNNEAAASLEAPPAADLSLAKTVDRPTPANGTDVTFTLTVTNHGPDATTGVEVTDQLPAGLAYVSDDGGGAYDPASGAWAVGDLAVGASASLRITATVTSPGEIVNLAEVTASGLPDPDSTPGNGDPGEDDRAQALLNADNRADLSLSKTVSPTSVIIGDTVTYTLVLRNAGPDRATGVVVRDQLPAGVSYVRHKGGTYDPDTGAWTVGTIGVGATRTLRITVRVGKLGTQVNRAEIAASNAFDPDSVPNNGKRSEDDLGAAAIGGLRPSLPPTSAASLPAGGGGPDLRWPVVALLVVTAVLLRARPWRRPRRDGGRRG
jgi:large repetitive protein